MVTTAVLRMVITGTNVGNLAFNSPEHFDELIDVSNGVFHPNGGGASYEYVDGFLMQSGAPGKWVFNAENTVPSVGTREKDGQEIVAFLPGITEKACLFINGKYGVGENTPEAQDIDIRTQMVDKEGKVSTGACQSECNHTLPKALKGYPFGCFKMQAEEFVYYHVILER